jgi:alkanesulfonate monooxygenase SsuD/methylene tetrahydromethanopterin reductase-like flavin-dependent oxidoreductase (luciferase family)
MKFGLFYELQLPRPADKDQWNPDDEHRIVQETLEQIEFADRLGYDYVFDVEHHFLEEYCHSSAPEVILGAVAARTQNIRLGHGIVQMPPNQNHPARVAERIATLDLLSNGRVEFGTGEGATSTGRCANSPTPVRRLPKGICLRMCLFAHRMNWVNWPLRLTR